MFTDPRSTPPSSKQLTSTPSTPSTPSTYAGNLSYEDRAKVMALLQGGTGIRLGNTIVPEGEALLPEGVEQVRKYQCEIDALPYFRDVNLALRTRIESEQHYDFKDVDIHSLRMAVSSKGRPVLGIPGQKNAWGYTKAGFNHATGFLKPRGLDNFSGNLLAMPPRIRADWFNWSAEHAVRSQESKVALRTLVEPVSGVRVIRAVTSAIHSLETGDDLAILASMENGPIAASLQSAKARVTRDLNHTTLEIIWPAMSRQLRTGDITKIGVRLENSETKAGSYRVVPFIFRLRCYNATEVVSHGGEDDITIKHVGDLRTKLPAAFTRALAKVDPFVKCFADAYAMEIGIPRGELLERVGKLFPDIPTYCLQASSKLWDADGEESAGDTLAGLVNAMTRASQDLGMSDAAVVEKAAGTLISNPAMLES